MKQGMGHRMSPQVPELSPTREQDHASLCGLGILLFQMTVKQNVCSLRGHLERKGMPVCTPSYDIYTFTRACARMRVHAHVHTPHTQYNTQLVDGMYSSSSMAALSATCPAACLDSHRLHVGHT